MVRKVALLFFWRTLAVLCVALGLIGIVLPGLPSVPFLLIAAWAGGKGWPALEAWLINHPRHGPAIVRWRTQGAVPRRAKWLASAMMVASMVVIAVSNAPVAAKAGIALFLGAVAWWLWRRPEG